MEPASQGSELLRALLDRLSWSPERLAREINRIAGPDTVSAKSPYGWLKGSVPRGRLPQLAALALSRALSEHITASQLWPTSRAGGIALTAHYGLDLAWTTAGAHRCAQLITEPTSPALLPVTGAIAVTPVMDWLTAPASDLPLRRTGEPISPEVLTILTERISQLRRLDDIQSGALLLDWITVDLRWAAKLACTGSYDPVTGAWLYRILGELAQLGGWVATDLGQRALGQRLLLAALHFAHTAGDRDLAANIVSCLSYLALWMGVPDDAVRLVRMARQGIGVETSGVVAALLASREARAHAVRGDTAACALALEDAETAFTERTTATPPWAYWVTEAVLAADAGRAWLEAGVPQRAEPLLERGLTLFGDDQPRNRLLHGISLAHARLALHDVDGGVDAADRALELLSTFDSARARSRLTELRTALVSTGATETERVALRIAELIHT
jgi:hypothetical protein